MNVLSLFQESFDDLVFENRNKSYGAYHLRKTQDVYMVRGMMFSSVFLLAIIFGPKLFARWDGDREIMPDEVCHIITLNDLPIVEPKIETPKPLPKSPKLPEVSSSIVFVEPKVVIDELPIVEKMLPTQQDLVNKVISDVTVKGSDNGLQMPNQIQGVTGEGKDENPIEVLVKTDEEVIYDIPNEKPSYPDGMTALMKYLSKNINYPSMARETGIEGKVIVQFVVSKDGTIDMAKVLRGIGGGCDEEALRVVKLMPKWAPGRNKGRPVNVRFTLPINFKLQ